MLLIYMNCLLAARFITDNYALVQRLVGNIRVCR